VQSISTFLDEKPGFDFLHFSSYPKQLSTERLQNVIERSLIFCGTDTFSVERAVITSLGGEINLEDSPPQSKSETPDRKTDTTELDDILDAPQIENLERQNIIKALNRCDWQISGKNGAAKLLGIPPTTLSSRMKALKIKRPI
jgi:transcriptional regulator with GAF, ATPase, and Fis domain